MGKQLTSPVDIFSKGSRVFPFTKGPAAYLPISSRVGRAVSGEIVSVKRNGFLETSARWALSQPR
jgi:hypothetical protein